MRNAVTPPSPPSSANAAATASEPHAGKISKSAAFLEVDDCRIVIAQLCERWLPSFRMAISPEHCWVDMYQRRETWLFGSPGRLLVQVQAPCGDLVDLQSFIRSELAETLSKPDICLSWYELPLSN